MATIDELTPEQIRYPEIYQKIKDLGDSFVRCVQAKEAYFLQEKLEALLNASNLQNFNPELYKNYQDFLAALKWTAFPLLSEENALLLLKNNYLSILDNADIDVQDRIEARMFTLDLFPRNELRQKMHGALKENNERLGNKTFGERLLDYNKAYDFRERDEMTSMKYISQDIKDQGLSELEKNKLRKALQIFDKTLLATPVFSEPLFSMAIRTLIKSGVIKERINPALLQSFPMIAATTPTIKIPPMPKPAEKPKIASIPKPIVEKKPLPTGEAGLPAGRQAIPLKAAAETKKPGLFEKLFGAKTKEPKETLFSSYEKQISPYEEKREMPSREITTFPEEKELETTIPEPEEPKKPEKPESIASPLPKTYQIRTMKGDIERIKKQPIPPRPEPKIKDNIVDLSGK